MNSIVIGMGQIGSAVYQVTGSQYAYDVSNGPAMPGITPVDVMHICFPYSGSFITDVRGYMEHYDPAHVIVWSTVPIGTCRQVDEKVVHSPVEGVHPDLIESIQTMRRFIGWNVGAEGNFVTEYFWKMGLSTKGFSNTETTELLKLRSTAKYGVNLVWADYEAKLCKQYGVNYSDLMYFDWEYNNLHERLGDIDWVGRYVLFPPDGEIGGHCVVPNAKLLNEQFPSDLLDKIIAMEKK